MEFAGGEVTLNFVEYFKSLKSPELRTAWIVAVAADVLQIAAFPVFAAGGLSPADAVLDFAVGGILVRLLGWHWAFLPSLLGELVPGLDLFPTWTAAMLFVTHQRLSAGQPEILPPGPAPARRL
jgi:hypothetical protein